MKNVTTLLGCAIVATSAALLAVGCGGSQNQDSGLDTRPLEESKAFEIIEGVLTQRGFAFEEGVEIVMSTKTRFECDFKAREHKIAIEYLTAKDRVDIGHIPAAAQGSRLHVLPARMASDDPAVEGDPVYVYFIDEEKYVYHYNPTSDHRADVTYLEIDSRLRRDLADFLTWYETSRSKEK